MFKLINTDEVKSGGVRSGWTHLASLVLSVCNALPGLQRWIWALCPSKKLLGVTGAFFFLGHSNFSERSLARSRGCQSWGRKVKVLSLIECDCTQVYFLLYIFYTGTRGDFVSCGNKPVNLSWDVRTITTLPRLFFLFSDLPLVFQLWMKKDLA